MKNLILVVSVLCSSPICGLETPEQSEQSHPRYAFNYGVRDYNTGDVKDHWEVRKGDAVKGSYSLVEADGAVRTVEYSADKRRGFRAVVSTTPKKSQVEKGGRRNPFRRPLEANPLEWRLPEVHPPESRGSVPSNHRPEYAGIADYKSLFDRYKSLRETTSNAKKQKFDYGINEYMAKRVRGRKLPEEFRRKFSRS